MEGERDGGTEGWRERGMEGKKDGGREGWRERGMEGERDGGREGWRERGMEGERDGGRVGWREIGMEGERDGGMEGESDGGREGWGRGDGRIKRLTEEWREGRRAKRGKMEIFCTVSHQMLEYLTLGTLLRISNTTIEHSSTADFQPNECITSL